MRRMISVVGAGVLLALGLSPGAQAAGVGTRALAFPVLFRIDSCFVQDGWATICQQVQLVGNYRLLPSGSALITQAVSNTITISDVVAPGLQPSTTTERYVTQQLASVDSDGRTFQRYMSTLRDGQSVCTTSFTYNQVGDTVVITADPQTRCHS